MQIIHTHTSIVTRYLYVLPVSSQCVNYICTHTHVHAAVCAVFAALVCWLMSLLFDPGIFRFRCACRKLQLLCDVLPTGRVRAVCLCVSEMMLKCRWKRRHFMNVLEIKQTI